MNAPSVIRHGLILVGGHPGKSEVRRKKKKEWLYILTLRARDLRLLTTPTQYCDHMAVL